jgi:hypothetical protein
VRSGYTYSEIEELEETLKYMIKDREPDTNFALSAPQTDNGFMRVEIHGPENYDSELPDQSTVAKAVREYYEEMDIEWEEGVSKDSWYQILVSDIEQIETRDKLLERN